MCLLKPILFFKPTSSGGNKMRALVRCLLPAAILGVLCHGAAMAADLSTVGQWAGKYPADETGAGKALWDQPGVEGAMRAAMGDTYFALSQKELHGPEGPVAGNGKGLFAAWSCKSSDCGGNQMTVFFDTVKGSAQVCWRSSDSDGGKVQDLWVADGKARLLSLNACGYVEKDPFAVLKKFGSAE
jgi:hypothetical protein